MCIYGPCTALCSPPSDEPCSFSTAVYPLFLLFYYFHYITDPPLCTLPTQPPVYDTSPLLHQTSLTYLMDIWSMDLIVTFPFLVTSCAPVVAQPITNHCAAWSGTYYSFASDESCACFLVYHLYITCLIYHTTPDYQYTSFPQISDLVCLPHLAHLPHPISHIFPIASYYITVPPSLPVTPCLEMIPYLQIAPSEPHRIYT